MLDSLNVQANKLILRGGEVLNKAETEAKIDEVAYASPENFVTGTGTANVSAKYVVIDPQHFTPGKLRSVSMHACAGTETKQVYLSIMEKPESVTEPNPHNWNPATWTHLGTSTNKVDEVGGRDSVWLFDGVILSNKPIACCEVYDPANTWDVDESRMGLWAFARPSSDTVSHIVGSLTVDMLPQATLAVSESVAEHVKDTSLHLSAGEHDKLTPILASVTKNGGTIEVDSAITLKNGKNLNHGGGASTFVSGNDEFNMSVRGFYGGTKIAGTLEKSVELTIDDDNNAVLKLNGRRVLTDGAREDLIPDSYFDSWFAQRTGKVYGTRVYDATNFATNASLKNCDLTNQTHDSTGITEAVATAIASVAKLADNAGLVHVISHGSQDGSAPFAGRDDYADIHLFMWKNCNYIRLADGTPRPTAIENERGIYRTTGAGVDVGVIGPTFWWGTQKITISGVDYDEIYISDSPGDARCPWPWIESVRPDGTVAPYYIHSKYMGGVDARGDIVSQPGLFMPANLNHNILTSTNVTAAMSGAWHPDRADAPVYPFQHKGPGYWGGGMSVYTFGIIFDLIKNGTKDGWNLHRGCKAWGCNGTHDNGIQVDPGASGNTGVYLSHAISGVGTDADGLQYVTLGSSSKAFDTSKRNRFMAGAYVSVGNPGTGLVTSPNNTTTNSIVRHAKISKVDYANKRLYLETQDGYSVPVADDLASYVAAGTLNTCKLCTIPFPAGSTDTVPGHRDGNAGTDPLCGIWPYRVQGTEYATGYWQVTTDHIKVYNSGEDGMWYAAPWVPRVSNGNATTIMTNYKNAGKWTMTTLGASVGNATFTEQGTLIPEVALNTASTASTAVQEGWRSKMYYSTSNVNEVLVGCPLNYLMDGGSLCVHVYSAVSPSYWNFSCRD